MHERVKDSLLLLMSSRLALFRNAQDVCDAQRLKSDEFPRRLKRTEVQAFERSSEHTSVSLSSEQYAGWPCAHQARSPVPPCAFRTSSRRVRGIDPLELAGSPLMHPCVHVGTE